jgi:lysozyme family protein
MKTVAEIAQEIVTREGGFVNDPADQGGPTKYGVTLATLKRLGIDVNGDGRSDIADLKSLSRAKAAEIFATYYFEKPGLANLPEALQPAIFDMYVNSGANAVKILQRLLVDMGHDLAVDGAVGPQTIAAAHGAALRDPVLFADAYGIARRNYYYALADARPQSRKFARRNDGGKGGWILRAEEFISPRFQLSAAQHRERTAKWG